MANPVNGTLWVRFRDPNGLSRTGRGTCEGRPFTIPRHQDAKDGAYWAKLPVVREDFLDGKIGFSCEAITGYNLMIDRVVSAAVGGLVEERALTFHDLLASQTDVGKTLLKAIAAEGKVAEITSGAFLSRHGIAAPSSARTALPNLIETDLVYRSAAGYMIYDYLFADYLRSLPQCY